jgi:hypothetical protein
MRRTPDMGSKILVTYLLLMGFSMCGYWVTQIASGFLSLGFATVDGGVYLAWHVVAEFVAAIFSILAAFLILGRNPLGYRLALFACGMLLYTGISSIGWGQVHDPGLLALFIICAAGALFGFFYILSRGEL